MPNVFIVLCLRAYRLVKASSLSLPSCCGLSSYQVQASSCSSAKVASRDDDQGVLSRIEGSVPKQKEDGGKGSRQCVCRHTRRFVCYDGGEWQRCSRPPDASLQVASVNNSPQRGNGKGNLEKGKGNEQREQLCSSTTILRVKPCVEGSDSRQYARGSGVGEGVKEGEEVGEREGTGDGRYRGTSVRINKKMWARLPGAASCEPPAPMCVCATLRAMRGCRGDPS